MIKMYISTFLLILYPIETDGIVLYDY